MAGETVNYYYLGHLLLALPAHALSLEPSVAYNLAVAGLFALSASAVFTLAGTLWAAALARGVRAAGGPVGAGLAAVALALVLGNLAGAREWLRADDPPGGYDWFAVSRVIPDTINEFPAFSFTLGDLHAHVLAIPFTLLAAAFALQVALEGPRGDLALRAVAEALTAGLAVGALYAINSWSYPVAAGLLVGAVVVWMRSPAARGRRPFGAVWTVLVLLAGVVLVLPFWLDFDPAARGIGWVDERRSFSALGGRHGADLRRARLGGDRRVRGPAARGAAARADRGVGRDRRRVRALAARAGRPRRRRAAARGARDRAARRAHGPARGARALPVAARRGRRRVRARARARLRARRVRQRRAVPDEHGLQARLPGLPAARGGRGLRAAVGRPLAAAPGLGRMGGGRRGPAVARARVPLRGQLGPPRRLPAEPDARRARLAARERPRRHRGDRVAAGERAGRRRPARGRRPRLLRLRPRAACPPSRAARP